MTFPKRTVEGYLERKALLEFKLRVSLPDPPNWRSLGPMVGSTRDDMMDSLVAAYTARRVALGIAKKVPTSPEVDPRGLRMEIHY